MCTCVYIHFHIYIPSIYVHMHIYMRICMYTHHSFTFQKHCRISEDCLGASHHLFQEVPHWQETTQYIVRYLHYLIFALNSIWLAFDSSATFDSRLVGVTLKSHLIPFWLAFDSFAVIVFCFSWEFDFIWLAFVPLLLLCFIFPENSISFNLHLFLCSYCVFFFLRMYIKLEELYVHVASWT